MSLGTTIARLRTEQGWTQTQLAERLEMHPQHVYRLEKDRYHPRPKTIEKLSQALGVKTDILTAAMDSGIPTGLTQEDPELSDLMAQVTILDQDKKGALKIFLKALLTCQQMQRLAGGTFVPG